MSSIYSNRQRLMTGASLAALIGCGIPGSNYAEFQITEVRVPEVIFADAETAGAA